jgi:phosphatidylglycerophosphate synthase
MKPPVLIPMTSRRADCYSAGERKAMLWTQQVRGRWLMPLLKILAACRITPDHLTLLSLACGLAFCPLYYFKYLPAAFAALVLHIVIDGLDGPLARHTGVDSRKGSFTDTMCDQTVVVTTTIALMISHTIDVAAGGADIFLYTVVVLFAMIRNSLAIPYSWLVRPRFVVYAWLLVEAYWWAGSLDYVLWGFNGLLAIKLLTGFVHIRHRI